VASGRAGRRALEIKHCDTRAVIVTGVRVRVLLHVGLLVERLAAVRAAERADVGVDQQVRAERRRAPERLATVSARIRPVGTVLEPVARQAGHVTERLVARGALERTLARHMRAPRVHLHTPLSRRAAIVTSLSLTIIIIIMYIYNTPISTSFYMQFHTHTLTGSVFYDIFQLTVRNWPLLCTEHNIKYKKLSYHRGTARCFVSIEILPIDTTVQKLLIRQVLTKSMV